MAKKRYRLVIAKKKKKNEVIIARESKRHSPAGQKRTKIEDALQRSADFHGFRPRRVRAIDVEWPEALVRIGHCSQINYISDKFDEKLREYFHKFEKPPVAFVGDKPQPGGREMLILIGNFKIKPEGIIG